MTARVLALSFSALLAACGCSSSALKPPNAEVPRGMVKPGPLAEGDGRVILDVADGPARVEIVDYVNPRMRHVPPVTIVTGEETSRLGDTVYYKITATTYPGFDLEVKDRRFTPLCRTPCVLDLPLGPRRLHVQSLDPDNRRFEWVDVDFTSTPTVHRRALGSEVGPTVGLAHALITGTTLVPGLLFGGLGIADLARSGEGPPARTERLQQEGVGLVIAGGLFLVGAVTLAILTAPTHQRGASRVFALPADSPYFARPIPSARPPGDAVSPPVPPPGDATSPPATP